VVFFPLITQIICEILCDECREISKNLLKLAVNLSEVEALLGEKAFDFAQPDKKLEFGILKNWIFLLNFIP